MDRLLPLKTKIEQHLKQRYGELFQAEFDVLLYDLISTYVEGAAEENPLMRRGYSRDHRPDCEQLVLAEAAHHDYGRQRNSQRIRSTQNVTQQVRSLYVFRWFVARFRSLSTTNPELLKKRRRKQPQLPPVGRLD